MAKTLFNRQVVELTPKRKKAGYSARLTTATTVLVIDLLEHAKKKLSRRRGLRVETVHDLLTALFSGEDAEVKIYITKVAVEEADLTRHWIIGKDPRYEITAYIALNKASVFIAPL